MDTTSLGDRMKGYEACPKNFLTRRMPVIIRLDGKAFHTFTKKLDKPYDVDFKNLMMKTAEYLVENIMGCRLAYVQSDEISLLLVDYAKIETEAWYNNNVQKMVSVSASMATAIFNKNLNCRIMFPEMKRMEIKQSFAMFDSRAFNLPREEVCNYFIWRQNDATRNSIQGLGQAKLGHKRMQGKNNNQVQDMLMNELGINWNDVDTYFKRGGCVYRGIDIESRNVERNNWTLDENWNRQEVEGTHIQLESRASTKLIVDEDIPQFSKDRGYINVHVDDNSAQLLESHFKRTNREIASSILEGMSELRPTFENIGALKFEIGKNVEGMDE